MKLIFVWVLAYCISSVGYQPNMTKRNIHANGFLAKNDAKSNFKEN